MGIFDRSSAGHESAPVDVSVERGAIAFFEGKMQEEGGTIHDLSDEQRAAFAVKYTDEMQQELIDSVGGDAERVYEAVVAARAACSG